MRKVQMVTDRELEILKVLWARGKASVREVQEDLNKVAGPVAYSTVQTLLNIMEDKKSLVRHVVEGRTFIYIPKKSSDRTIRELTHRFLDRVFDGAVDRMMVASARHQAPECRGVRPPPRDARRSSESSRKRGSARVSYRRSVTRLLAPRQGWRIERGRGMANWADRCESIWLDATLAAVLVTGFTALAMIQCRQPARRRAWGRMGLAASLAVVLLAALSPVPRIDIRSPTASVWAERSPVVEPLADPVGDRPPSVPARTEPGHEPEARVRIQSGGPGRDGVSGFAPCLRVRPGAWDQPGDARRGGGANPGTPVHPSVGAGDDLAASSAVCGSGSATTTITSLRPVGPAGAGRVLATIILIPPELDRLDAEPQLRLGLLHELAHAEAGDHRFGLVAALAHATWFFLPQVWWIRSQLRLDAEFLADHRAVGHFGTSFRYAESLVGLALAPSLAATVAPTGRRRRVAACHRGRSAPGSLASALLQRVQMLLKCPFEVEDPRRAAWSMLVALAVLSLTLGASSPVDQPIGGAEPRG